MMSYTWNQLLSYKTQIGRHNLDVMAGHEFYNYNMRYIVAERTGFPFADYDDLGMGSTLAEANSASDNYSINSYLCRVNYDFSDRYYLSASFRMDASVAFQEGEPLGSLLVGGASWRISQEKFLSDVSWIDNITLKASYGVQGNDNLGSYYAWQSLYDMNYPNANQSGAVINSIENRDVTWEKNGNLNVGVEFRLFDRLTGTVEWYNRKTTDLLLEYPMAISARLPGLLRQCGQHRQPRFRHHAGRRHRHDARLALERHGDGLHAEKQGSEAHRQRRGHRQRRLHHPRGQEINTFYMSKSAGVDPTTGEQLYWAYEKNADGSMKPGSEYVTNDATVAASCKYLQGSRIPDIYGSISSSLKFRGFDLGLLFTYSLGGKIYDSIYNA